MCLPRDRAGRPTTTVAAAVAHRADLNPLAIKITYRQSPRQAITVVDGNRGSTEYLSTNRPSARAYIFTVDREYTHSRQRGLPSGDALCFRWLRARPCQTLADP